MKEAGLGKHGRFFTKHMGCLFDDYGFEVIGVDGPRGMGFFRIRLENDQYRVIFDTDRSPVILGSIQKRPTDGKGFYGYDLIALVNFLAEMGGEKENMFYMSPIPFKCGDKGFEWQVARLNRLLKPNWERLFKFISEMDKESEGAFHEYNKRHFFPQAKTREELIERRMGHPSKIERDPWHEITYYPCETRLKDGSSITRVCMVDKGEFKRAWGDDLGGMGSLDLSEVVRVYGSKEAFGNFFSINEAYLADKGRDGRYKLKVAMKDRRVFSYETGRFFGFLEPPEGYKVTDFNYIIPEYEVEGGISLEYKGKVEEGVYTNMDFVWCFV